MKGVKLAPGTNISHTNHAVAFPSSFSFPSLFWHSAAFCSTVASCHQCYPAYQLSSSTSERLRITQTIQTHWLYLIKLEWPGLSNSSPVSLVVETNIEMAWRAFREGGFRVCASDDYDNDVDAVISGNLEFSLKLLLLLHSLYFYSSSRKFKHRTIMDSTCCIGETDVRVSSCIITSYILVRE